MLGWTTCLLFMFRVPWGKGSGCGWAWRRHGGGWAGGSSPFWGRMMKDCVAPCTRRQYPSSRSAIFSAMVRDGAVTVRGWTGEKSQRERSLFLLLLKEPAVPWHQMEMHLSTEKSGSETRSVIRPQWEESMVFKDLIPRVCDRRQRQTKKEKDSYIA